MGLRRWRGAVSRKQLLSLRGQWEAVERGQVRRARPSVDAHGSSQSSRAAVGGHHTPANEESEGNDYFGARIRRFQFFVFYMLSVGILDVVWIITNMRRARISAALARARMGPESGAGRVWHGTSCPTETRGYRNSNIFFRPPKPNGSRTKQKDRARFSRRDFAAGSFLGPFQFPRKGEWPLIFLFGQLLKPRFVRPTVKMACRVLLGNKQCERIV